MSESSLVRGYPPKKSTLSAVQYGDVNCQLRDILTESDAAEFTLLELGTFATIDLAH